MFDRSYSYYNEALSLFCGEICNSPRMAIIYPVYGCNFSCVGCLCSDFNMEKVYMDLEKFKELTIQLKHQGVKSIEFCGGGEPLLHPHICEMISWITDNLHMNLGIITNGSLLTEQLSYYIVTRASYIRVSLYDNSYHDVMKKVERLISIKKSVDSDIVIGTKFLINKHNEELVLQRVKEVAENEGINHVSVKGLRENDIVEDYTEIGAKINELGYEKVHANLKKSRLKGRCWMAPIHTLTDPLGDVYICCYYMDRKNDHCIGNAFEKPFTEIWGSREHLKKNSNIDPVKCNVYDCRWHEYNSKMLSLLKNNTHHQFC